MTEAIPGRILVIMLRRIGDVLLTTPAVRALRREFPKARIDFLTEGPGAQILRGNPDIDEVLTYRSGPLSTLSWLAKVKGRYDWTVDFMGTPRSALLAFATRSPIRAGPAHVLHRWAYNRPLRQSSTPCYSALEKIKVLRHLGLSPDESDHLPVLRIPEDSERFAAVALARLIGTTTWPLIALLPASRRVTRQWPARSYAELGRRLRESHGANLLVCWGPGEKELALEVASGIGPGAYLAPPTPDLMHLAALLRSCRMAVTNCNGPKHIAVAAGIPTLTIHASSDPACWNPPDATRHPFIRLESLHCIGCRRNRCPYALECLRGLPVEEVHAAAGRLFEAAAMGSPSSERGRPPSALGAARAGKT